MKFSKATKTNSYLKLALSGPPGSGKSYSALSIAQPLSEKRIAVIDAEAGAASKYANLFDFDVLDLTIDDEGHDIAKPYSPLRYMEAIKAAYDSGIYDILIIDGISPEWDDAGGCLQWVDQITRNNDTRAAWKVVTPAHKQFINYILRVRMHVICTMLAKKETVAVKNENGKVIGQKVTLDPIQRDDVPRVFDVFASMQNKDMILDKTRCPELDDQVFHKPGKDVADILREWLKGDPMPERPDYAPDITQSNGHQPAQADVPATDQQLASIRKLHQHLGKPEFENEQQIGYLAAKAMIESLSKEYRESREKQQEQKPLLNGDGTQAFPWTPRTLYTHGKQRGLWSDTSTSKFYAFASAVVGGRAQSKDAWDMSADEMVEMARQIEQEPAKASSGK